MSPPRNSLHIEGVDVWSSSLGPIILGIRLLVRVDFQVNTVLRASIISLSTVGPTLELSILESAKGVELLSTAFCVVEIEQPHKIIIIKKPADLLHVIRFMVKFILIRLELALRN